MSARQIFVDQGNSRSRTFQTRRWLTLVSLLVCVLVLSIKGECQIKVTLLMKGKTPLKSSSEIKVSQFGLWTPTDVQVGMVLNPGDLMECANGGLTMEIRIGKTLAKLTERFRFAVLPPSGNAIGLNLLSGTANIQTSTNTWVSAGTSIMGSRGTEYEVRAFSSKLQTPVQECIVFEGRVDFKSQALPNDSLDGYQKEPFRTAPPAKPVSFIISSGEKISVNKYPASPAPEKIDKEDIVSAAVLYATTDTGKAQMVGSVSDPIETQARLMERYETIFLDPQNPAKRIQLAVEQVNLKIGEEAFYQLDKAEQFTPAADANGQATIALTRGAALTQVGRPGEASREFQKAQKADPSVFNDGSLRKLGFNDASMTVITHAIGTGEGVTETFDQYILFRLLNEGRFQEALNGFQGRIKRGQSDSRDYYGMSEAYFSLESKSAAAASARTALDLSAQDKRLSQNDYKRAEYIIKQTGNQTSAQPDESVAQPTESPIGKRSAWPIPNGLSARQAQIFRLIQEKNFSTAARIFVTYPAEAVFNSIDYYALAIIRYETKDLRDARTAAEAALSYSSRDQRLSEDVNAACRRIIATTPER